MGLLARGRLYGVVILAAVALAACTSISPVGGTTKVGSAPYEQGSGKVATESREVPTFNAVTAAQGVRVAIGTGPQAVTVSADDNLLTHLTTTVADGTLVIDIAGSIETRLPLKVEVTTTTPLERLSASTGSTIAAPALEATSLAVDASTGSTVDAGGHVVDLKVSAVGGATADLRDVGASRATVEVNTGSTAHVNASDSVAGSCSLGSTLVVRGTASTSGVTVDSTSSLGRE